MADALGPSDGAREERREARPFTGEEGARFGTGPRDGARDERREVRPLAAEEGARFGTRPREGARLPAREAGRDDGARDERRAAVLRGLMDLRGLVGIGGRSASWSNVSSAPMEPKDASGSSDMSSEIAWWRVGNSMLGATASSASGKC
jgi:hypothetical protein